MARIPKLCRRDGGRRLYVTDPASGRQIKIIDDADYERWRAEFVARSDRSRQFAGIVQRANVAELLAAYLAFADGYYRKRGEPTSHVNTVAAAVVAVRECWGDRRDASSIRGPDLLALQQHLVTRGLARSTINRYVAAVRRIWRWGLTQEAVDAATVDRLRSVSGLKVGRTEARETARIRPVPPDDLARTLPELEPTTAAMVRLQLWGGARPGEICALRPCDVDRSGAAWAYRVDPDWDKTAHRGKGEGSRVVWFGPQSQAVLGPLLDAAADPAAPLFRGLDGTRVSTNTYARRIGLACERAGVPPWRPNRLRHSRATDVRAKRGLDAARAVLGHTDAATTLVYAERDEELAKQIAAELG